MNNCLVIDEETYLSINDASRQSIGERALHKNKGNNSDKTWTKIVNKQLLKDKALCIRREELRKKYADKVLKGELRPPTRIERLTKTAQGHPDHPATQAAIRILKRMNNEQTSLF